MRGKAFSSKFIISACIALLCLLLIGLIHYSKGKTQEGTFTLKKISAFNVDEKLLHNFVRGQLSQCSEQPEPGVKIYPAFRSDKPLYGSIRFAEEYGQKESGVLYHFALDESQGMGTGYDRLYFDLDRDLDLTNEEPGTPLKNPPNGAILNNKYTKKQVLFDYLNVNFENNSTKSYPLEIMPRLSIYESGSVNLSFVTAEARKGKIRIAGRRYDVLLGHNYLVTGSFNRPYTALHLIPDGDIEKQLHWQGAERLMAIHKIEGTNYCFSATPAGDKLTAQPYDGKLGTFMGGPGERNLTYVGCQGSLSSEDKAVAIGTIQTNGWTQLSFKSEIPVGDYLPLSLTIQYKTLRIYLSDNYHADGKPLNKTALMSKTAPEKRYGIKIREGEPFVFDFSNKPDVLFALPAKDNRIKPGEELTVKAVLIDPELDIMIRGLTDTTRKKRRERTSADGRKYSFSEQISLDPKVIIKRANGEKVVEGVMPFG